MLQVPQKLGSVCRLAQKGPELVAQACTGGLGFTHVTVHAPAGQSPRAFSQVFLLHRSETAQHACNGSYCFKHAILYTIPM